MFEWMKKKKLKFVMLYFTSCEVVWSCLFLINIFFTFCFYKMYVFIKCMYVYSKKKEKKTLDKKTYIG
jgi:hypothetical protein